MYQLIHRFYYPRHTDNDWYRTQQRHDTADVFRAVCLAMQSSPMLYILLDYAETTSFASIVLLDLVETLTSLH